MTIRSVICLVCAFYAAMPVWGHEFWLTPSPGPFAAGDSVSLTLRVGEYFEGDLIAFSTFQTLDFRHYDANGSTDLRALLPRDIPVSRVLVPLPKPGTHMFIFNSQATLINLPAGSFHAYLHDEGLDFIRAQREAAGTAGQPGRERYRRFVKTLLRVTPGSDALSSREFTSDTTHSTITGQRLEIVPMKNPLIMLPGDVLDLRVIFDGKPLEGGLLKAWHKQGNQTFVIRARTAADGTASFDLPYAGSWMISVVHMVPAIGVKGIDWDSLWGNLSFNLGQ